MLCVLNSNTLSGSNSGRDGKFEFAHTSDGRKVCVCDWGWERGERVYILVFLGSWELEVNGGPTPFLIFWISI